MDLDTLTRRFVDTYNSRQLEAQIELFDPEIELVPIRAVLEDTVYRGHDGVRRFARDLEEFWSEAHVEILELEARGEQAVSIDGVRLKALVGRSDGGNGRPRLVHARRATAQNGLSPNTAGCSPRARLGQLTPRRSRLARRIIPESEAPSCLSDAHRRTTGVTPAKPGPRVRSAGAPRLAGRSVRSSPPRAPRAGAVKRFRLAGPVGR